ncbi:hypothetical protein [Bacillus sp. OV322]|uniref:hypothetical protein n=1 Tax=Bacillus sp. OV322 TaxID=1882764 RepID=UPI000B85F494|nr:hypothetical protein [Bacillus sp. OV322]
MSIQNGNSIRLIHIQDMIQLFAVKTGDKVSYWYLISGQNFGLARILGNLARMGLDFALMEGDLALIKA